MTTDVIRDAVSEVLPASCGAVFELVHDYRQRLTWDTLLREAFVEGDGPAANGAIAVCSGKWLVGGLSLRTVYVSFRPGKVAAVKMINTPPFFATWAASIRHEPLEGGQSRVIYTWNFTAKPKVLAFILEPVMAWFFRWETRKRLRALKRKLAG
ncbi:MAG: SRPBCC family protein [Archangium sp.]|nr:SRPBCC family protein [Archangium sp.]